jgi:uncharacterized protein
VPRNLGTKFKYSAVSQEARARELSLGLDLLEQAGLVTRAFHTSANGVPLSAEADVRKFKVFALDMGLANRVLGLRLADLQLRERSLVNRGAMAEQWVAQQLVVRAHTENAGLSPNQSLHYWHREARASNAEVDFVVAHGASVVPIEVKSGSTGRMRSLLQFLKEKELTVGVRICADPRLEFLPVEGGCVLSMPFYLMPFMDEAITAKVGAALS